MAKNSIIEATDAIVTDLNAQNFSQDFDAVRSYAPIYTLEEMATLRVTVVPREPDVEQQTRGGLTVRTDGIDIGIQKRFEGEPTQAELDGMMLLVQEIDDRCYGRTFTGADGLVFVCTDVANDPPFVPEHIRQFHQFTSVLKLSVLYTR